MAKSYNPYGLSLFEYKGSNFSGTLYDYPIAAGSAVIPSAQPVAGTIVNDITGTIGATGIFSGDLVTWGPCLTAAAAGAGTFSALGTSIGSLMLASSSAYKAAIGNMTALATLSQPRAILGVFQGVNMPATTGNPANTRQSYIAQTQVTSMAAGTVASAKINDLADCIFQVQCNAALGTTQAAAMQCIGNFYGFVNNGVGGSNQQSSVLGLDVASEYGYSTNFVNAPNGAGATQYPFRLIGLAPIQGNSWTDPFPEVLVMINNHMWKPGQIS